MPHYVSAFPKTVCQSYVLSLPPVSNTQERKTELHSAVRWNPSYWYQGQSKDITKNET